MAKIAYQDDKVGYTVEKHAGELLELYMWGPYAKVQAFRDLFSILFDETEYQTNLEFINHDNGYATMSFIRKLKNRRDR